METLVKLEQSDKQIVLSLNKKYNKDLIEKSFNSLLKAGLSYNTKTGYTFIKKTWVSKPSTIRDIGDYKTREDVIKWEFMANINNSAIRLSKGYTVL